MAENNDWYESPLGIMSRFVVKDGETFVESYTDPLKAAVAKCRMSKSPEEVLAAVRALQRLPAPEDNDRGQGEIREFMLNRLGGINACGLEYAPLLYRLLSEDPERRWNIRMGLLGTVEFVNRKNLIARYRMNCAAFREAMEQDKDPEVVTAAYYAAKRDFEELSHALFGLEDDLGLLGEFSNTCNGWQEAMTDYGATYFRKQAAAQPRPQSDPAGHVMNYFEALEATVSLDEAKAELKRHQVEFIVDVRGVIIDIATGATIAEPDDYGEYAGSAIVEHLGY